MPRVRRPAAESQRMLYEWLRSRGRFGATIPEMSRHLRLDYAAVGHHLYALRERGLAVPTDRRRENTDRVGKVKIWVAADPPASLPEAA